MGTILMTAMLGRQGHQPLFLFLPSVPKFWEPLHASTPEGFSERGHDLPAKSWAQVPSRQARAPCGPVCNDCAKAEGTAEAESSVPVLRCGC